MATPMNDAQLGSHSEYQYLLGHGAAHALTLPEYQRREYPWLHTKPRKNWERLLEALKVLGPKEGALTLRSLSNSHSSLAEVCQIHFAFETNASGGDTYTDKLLEQEAMLIGTR